MGIVFIIGTVQAFFIEFILLNKKKKELADKILAVWMFFIGFHLFLFYLEYTGILVDYPHLKGVLVPLPLIHGPFLLLYVNALIKPYRDFNRLDYLHFFPLLFSYAIMLPQFSLSVPDLKSHIADIEADRILPFYIQIIGLMVVITGIVYVPWALVKITKHKKSLGNQFSFKESIDLKWLRNIIWGIAGIWVAVIVTNVLYSYVEEMKIYGDTVIFSAVTVFIFLIGYHGIRQGRIFTDNRNESKVINTDDAKVKYQKSTLKKEEAEVYLKALKEFMLNHKPYLEPKITLPKLAERLDINPNKLSQTINEQLGKNFYDFINQYRIDEFKKRIADDSEKRITLLGHALESGFSSKSSFNEVFKKSTGQTPSEYYKQVMDT